MTDLRNSIESEKPKKTETDLDSYDIVSLVTGAASSAFACSRVSQRKEFFSKDNLSSLRKLDVFDKKICVLDFLIRTPLEQDEICLALQNNNFF